MMDGKGGKFIMPNDVFALQILNAYYFTCIAIMESAFTKMGLQIKKNP